KHHVLSALGDDEVRSELLSSQEKLTRELGAPARFLAYPNGHPDDFDARAVAAAKAAGFHFAFTMTRDVASTGDDPLRLPRHAPGNEPGAVLALDLLRLVAKRLWRERFAPARPVPE